MYEPLPFSCSNYHFSHLSPSNLVPWKLQKGCGEKIGHTVKATLTGASRYRLTGAQISPVPGSKENLLSGSWPAEASRP